MSEGLGRRGFLKVVGVSGAGAAVGGCSTGDVERLMPYVTPPEEITPGVATWYATACQECSAGCGVWVRTREGRAVKLEGNPSHPVSGGALCSRGHSALQDLYNPDRIRTPMRRAGDGFEAITWDEAEAALTAQLQGAAGNVLFIHGHQGPSMSALTAELLSALGGRSVQHEAGGDAPLAEAARIAFGVAGSPRYDIDRSRLLFSFGADFLGPWISQVEHGRQFSAMSHADERGAKGRLVHIGPRLSLTGQNADEWVPINPGSEAALALGMARIIADAGGSAGPYATLLASYDTAVAAEATGIPAETIAALATRFATEGPSLALGPGVQGHHRGATAANLAVLVLNAVAGNVGRTVHPGARSEASGTRLNAALLGAAGGVVMVHGTNPAYSLAPAAGFEDAYAAASYRIAFTNMMDETAALSDLVLPDRHFLESWGDMEAADGTQSIVQPVMELPAEFTDSRQAGDVLLAAAARLGQPLSGTNMLEYVQARWEAHHAQSGAAGTFTEFWREALRSGVAASAEQPTTATLQSPDTALSFQAPAIDGDGEFFLTVYPDPRLADGRGANRPWLQELPDPVSKMMWQTWIEMHPDAAHERGLKEGDVVRLTSPHGTLEAPVWLYAGIRPDTVGVPTGNGHTSFGRWGTDQGVNPMTLLPGDPEVPSGAALLMATRVDLEPTGEWQKLASSAGSDSDQGRPIAEAVALSHLGEETHEEEGHGPHRELQLLGGFKPVEQETDPAAYPPAGTAYGPYSDPAATPRWAMTIDLDKCTGCSACVTACQAENNVPWVGEDQVLMGREMHWMRIERYHVDVHADRAGSVDVRNVPMLCQHCGNAPCEPVCPVFAAYHTPDGLNAQVYNRCVGTRYCANNCPYKVRVFNWYRYTSEPHVPAPMQWQYNPDVTVRDNGVMEKCTFCIQRIRDAQNTAVVEQRGLREGDVVTACQQSCPAEAITFGNVRDPNARVTVTGSSTRAFHVLDELVNTQPAITYLKKVTFHELEAAEDEEH